MKEIFKFKSKDWNQNCHELINGIIAQVGQVDHCVMGEDDEYVSVMFSEAGELNSPDPVVDEKPVGGKPEEGKPVGEKPGLEEEAKPVEPAFNKIAAMKALRKIGEKAFEISCVNADIITEKEISIK